MNDVIRQCCQCMRGVVRIKGNCAVFLQTKALSINMVKFNTPATSRQNFAKAYNCLRPVIRYPMAVR